MPAIDWDIETYSEISLKEHGADVYAAHKSTGVHFLCYAIDDGEVQTWRPGDPVRRRSPTRPAIDSGRIIGRLRTRSSDTY